MNFKEVPLEKGEWIEEVMEKDTIFLHHTAGGHRADWTAAGWDRDRANSGNRKRVATAFIIGGKSTRDGNGDWDGVVVRCFPEEEWAYHLGVKGTGWKAGQKDRWVSRSAITAP